MARLHDEELAGELLDDLLRSPGWREVARPALESHRRRLQERLARGLTLPEEQLRQMQHRYALLDVLLERPREFFMPPAMTDES